MPLWYVEHSAWYKIVVSKNAERCGLAGTIIIGDDRSGRIYEIKQNEGSEILLFGSPSCCSKGKAADKVSPR